MKGNIIVVVALIAAINSFICLLSLHAKDNVEKAHLQIYTNSHFTLTDLRELIADKFNIPISNIFQTSRFYEDLHLDELDLEELRLECEYEYNIEIADTEFVNIKTVMELYNLIRNKL